MGTRIHVIGVAYKRDIDDLRESPALDIIHLLAERGAKLTYSDPWIANLQTDGVKLSAIGLEQGLAECECAVIVTDHTSVDYAAVVEQAPLVVDTRNALRGIVSEKIVRL
jgi:UDP-N-acetyl-D-glucosamine dehydrogenase